MMKFTSPSLPTHFLEGFGDLKSKKVASSKHIIIFYVFRSTFLETFFGWLYLHNLGRKPILGFGSNACELWRFPQCSFNDDKRCSRFYLWCLADLVIYWLMIHIHLIHHSKPYVKLTSFDTFGLLVGNQTIPLDHGQSIETQIFVLWSGSAGFHEKYCTRIVASSWSKSNLI